LLFDSVKGNDFGLDWNSTRISASNKSGWDMHKPTPPSICRMCEREAGGSAEIFAKKIRVRIVVI